MFNKTSASYQNIINTNAMLAVPGSVIKCSVMFSVQDLNTVKQRKAEQEAKEKAEKERQRRIEEKLRNQVSKECCWVKQQAL